MRLYQNSSRELVAGTKVWSPVRAGWFPTQEAKEKHGWVHVSAELVRRFGIEEAKLFVVRQDEKMAGCIGRLCDTVADVGMLAEIEIKITHKSGVLNAE
jgi:hypothetical protein